MTSKIFRTVLALTLVLGFCAAPALAGTGAQAGQAAAAAQEEPAAQDETTVQEAHPPVETNLLKPLVALGAGLVTLGGAFAIGKLAAAAVEGTARQPEAGGAIRTSMIIAAALIEGFTFFALIVCMIAT